jgi:transglutaminase-like putative cysteine protease
LVLAPEDEVLFPEDEPELPACPPELCPCPEAPDGDAEPPPVEQPAATSVATKIAARLETLRDRAVRFEDMLPLSYVPNPVDRLTASPVS